MATKPKISSSLQRLLKREQETESPQPFSEWIKRFSSEKARKGLFQLLRADGEKFSSLPLTARENERHYLDLIVDSLLPTPTDEFWLGPVSLHGEMRTFDEGVEEITTFIASVGEQIDYEGRPAIELKDLIDLKLETREYVAALGNAHTIALGFIWQGEWIETLPSHATISRLFFRAPLVGEVNPDGYAVPKATLRIGDEEAEIPARLQLKRNQQYGFEAIIEKIDGLAHQNLVALIEDIWLIASGLGQNRLSGHETVGYMMRDHDPLAEAFEPHIILLCNDPWWESRLEPFGRVTTITGHDVDRVKEVVKEGRCDLIIGDYDEWSDDAIHVERLMRSVSKLRNVPRLWFGENIDAPRPRVETSSNDYNPDLIDFGAFDLFESAISDDDLHQKVKWALGGDVAGNGAGVMLISGDARLRYRLGLALGTSNTRFTILNRLEGLIPTLDKRLPRWLLVDLFHFDFDKDALLARTLAWARQHRAKVIVLSRGASADEVTKWFRAGADDIIVTDASLREAVGRLQQQIHGTA